MASNATPAVPAGAGAPLTNVLYVVLHGLISLVDVGATGFIAFALDMGDEHRYLYGNWLTEDAIPARPENSQPLIAELAGVDSGIATLNSNENVIVQLQQPPDIDHDHVRAVFKLPRPSKIHHFVSGTLDPATDLGGTMGAVVGAPVALSSIRIFEYSFKDNVSVQLTRAIGTQPLWQCPGPVNVSGTNLKVAVLHIYDQPGDDMVGLPQHTISEFQKSAQFLGTDLTLTNAIIVDNKTAAAPGSLPGMLHEETSCLSRRSDEVLGLLDRLRANPKTLGGGVGGCNGGGVCAACNAVLRT